MASKAEIFKALDEYARILDAQDEKGSTGSFGKWVDVITRRFLNKKGELYSTQDARARPLGKSDGRCAELGEYDVKTNSSGIIYGENLTKADATPENILPNCASVVWFPGVPPCRTIDPLILFRLGFIFTRAQFIDVLEYAGKKGLQSMIKVSKGGGQINIQTLNPVPLGKIFDYIEENNIPTVYNWGMEHGRKWRT